MPSLGLERPRASRPLRARPEAEPLEGRSLLSHVSAHLAPHTSAIHASPARQAQTLEVQVPNSFIGPGTSEVNVTLSRSSPAGAAGLSNRLAVVFFDDYWPILGDPAAAIRHAERPGVSRNVTFQPGQASVTIPVPVPAVPAGFGSVVVPLSVRGPSRLVTNFPQSTSLVVFASADQIPPAIVATRLTPQGLALTFSKPMDPSTVQNINNYDVTDYYGTTVALKSAVYDPTTQTVTLITTKPLDLANSYSVANARGVYRPGTQLLTDLEGNPIEQWNGYTTSAGTSGFFFVGVGPGLSTVYLTQ